MFYCAPGANILSTKQGTVKLADFGVATMIGKAESSGKNDEGMDADVAGTPYWSKHAHGLQRFCVLT